MIGICDANNFYVSCERVFNPALNGRPVVVLSNNDRCIIARSNEAKTLGLKMGQPIYQIADVIRANHVVLCSSNFKLYGDMSRRMQTILKRFVPQTEVYSVDEAFLDFRGMDLTKLDELGHTISRTVRHSTGLPVSVGIAPTKTLAKIASKLCKKYPKLNGACYMYRPEDIEKVLRKTPVGDVWGIGGEYKELLLRQGVKTAYDFTQLPPGWVRKRMTVEGLRTWKELRGEPCIEIVVQNPKKKQICNSCSFPSEVSDLEELHTAVATFTTTVAEKLRKQKSVCGELVVFIHTNYFKENAPVSYESLIVRFSVRTDSTLELVAAATDALKAIFRKGFAYKKAGVILSDIAPKAGVQTSIFDTLDRGKHSRLMEALDRINETQGRRTVVVASRGFDPIKMDRQHLSRGFTTDLDDIIRVKTE